MCALGTPPTGVARPPAGCGSYSDLDGIQMLQILNNPRLLSAKPHMYNAMFLEQRGRTLEPRWKECNGLCDLRYTAARRRETRMSADATLLHVTATLSG